jgi:Uma2 family endonuclease
MPVSISTQKPQASAIKYPETDDEPIAENTLQFQWIVTIKGGLDTAFWDRQDIFVAGDLFWYPVEGRPDIRTDPDIMVAVGRPRGHRGSYKQWEEGAIAPQVVFEILSPGNRPTAMLRKFKFYEEYGCLEYYIYDPDDFELMGFQRSEGELREVVMTNGWVSPCLGIRFDASQGELKLFAPDGRAFLTYEEIAAERDRLIRERDSIAAALETERQRNESLIAQLGALGGNQAK